MIMVLAVVVVAIDIWIMKLISVALGHELEFKELQTTSKCGTPTSTASDRVPGLSRSRYGVGNRSLVIQILRLQYDAFR